MFDEDEDEDGDRIAVRDDDDLVTFVTVIKYVRSMRIWLVCSPTIYLENISVILPSDLKHLSIISHGQFGSVYKSIHVASDRIIAAKCIALDGHMSRYENVLKEMALIRECAQCEFIIDLLGVAVESNTFSICLEYMDGGALGQYGSIPNTILPHICRSIFEGLRYLWDINIMHRDLKPNNILVNTNGLVKLSDFGVSKMMEHSIARSFVGTYIYMAPERVYGGAYRIKSDIWSFGLTIFELAIGRFPLNISDDETPVAVLNHIVREEIVIETILEQPNSLTDLIRGCLIKDVNSRSGIAEVANTRYIKRTWPINRKVISNLVSAFISGLIS